MNKLALLIRWEFIRYGYENMVHVEDLAKQLGYSEGHIEAFVSRMGIRRPEGQRVKQKRRAIPNTVSRKITPAARKSRQRGAIASKLAQREIPPITLAGPKWSWPERARA